MSYTGTDTRNSEGTILKFSELRDILLEVTKIKECVMYREVFHLT